jgi:hypothetical protein
MVAAATYNRPIEPGEWGETRTSKLAVPVALFT